VNLEQFEAAKKLIKRMNIDFDSRNFENPTIQKHYATLQALALGESEVEKIEDLLRPDPDGLKNLNGVDTQFRKLCFTDGGGTKKTEVEIKRKARTKSEEKSDDNKKGNGGKRKKAEDTMEVIEEVKESMEKTKKKKKIDDSVKREDNNLDYDEGYSDRVLLKMLENDELKSLTVPKLKDIMNARNFDYPKSSKKTELLEKLNSYLFKSMK
jgi:ATP-dependent DNA helicase 2 subunit 1